MNKGHEFVNGAYPRRYEGHEPESEPPTPVKVVVTPTGHIKIVDNGPLVPFGNTWG